MSSGVILKGRAVDLRKAPSKSQNCSELQVESCNLNDGNRRQSKGEISGGLGSDARVQTAGPPVQQKCHWSGLDSGDLFPMGPREMRVLDLVLQQSSWWVLSTV